MMNASTCADLNAVTSTQGINFTLGQVTVVYAKAPYIYVQDATGTALVYSNWNVFKRLVPGDVVHSITGTAKLYSNLPELMPTDSMISKSSGTAPAIPDATAAPTTADINKVFIYRDVDMGSQSFPNGSATNKTGTFSGGSVLFRNAWKEAYQFDATKTYDILGCVSIYGSTIQVYAAEITEHHEMGFNPIVIGAEKPSTWNAMYLYAWADEGTLLGQWPGTAVNVDSAGWAYHTFEGLSEVNYIWNDGNGTQTVDLLARGSVCQRLMAPQPHISNPKWTATTVECGSHETLPSDTTVIGEPITVRLFPSSIVEGWESGNGVFLYAWTGDSTKVLGNWPGYPVDKVNGWYSYTFPAYIQDVNIIWSNGGMSTPNQTENILNVTASTCYSLGYRTTMIDDYATGNIHYEANVVDCASETMLMPLYWVNNQAADGDHVATQPLTVTFAKKPYFYVQDNAGTAGLIYDTRSEWTDLVFNDLITGFEGDVKVYNGLKELIPTLSYVDWGVSNQTEYITIPTATSAPTVADMNKVFRFVNVSFGNASFTTETKKNITATMANGETFAARNQWQEAYTFEANKTYDFTGCVAEYNGSVQVYATNFVEHAGPTPQPGDSTIQDTITLGFGNAFAWDSVYLYAWDDNQNPLLGQWPGTPMTLDSSQWAYKTFIGAGKINYIWNNGKYSSQAGARQTQDLTARASVCQAPDPFATNYPFGVVEIECGANPDFVFDLSFEQALAVGALADITNPSYYTYRTTGVVSSILTSPENVDRYKNCDFFITNPNNPNDNSIECFRTKWLHDQAMYADNMPAVGDTVTIVGSLQYYQGRTVEFNRGYIESIARQLPPDTTVAEPLTVKLLASSVREIYDCKYVNLYAWRTEPDGSYIDVPLGGWPGTSVPLDSATGWYHYTFAPEIQDVNIIWSRGCDGGYRQTQNIMHVTYNQCFRLMQDSSGIIAVGANCSTVEPIVPYIPDTTHQDTVPQGDYHYTMRLSRNSVVDAGWQGVGLYAWIADSAGNVELPLGEWPGAPVDNNEDPNWYSYSFFTNRPLSGMIWNNMSGGYYGQTEDIMNVSTGTSCYKLTLPAGAVWYLGEEISCEGSDTIAPQPQQGITIKLAASSVPESWEEVRIHSWTNGVDSLVRTGFGLVLEPDSGWYSYTFPVGINQVDFLFNNGSWGAGNQTVDGRAFASTCYGLDEPDETTDYHFPFLLADCVTGEVYPESGDTSAHTVYIWDNISRIYWDSIVVPYGGDVTLPTDLPEYEGYHFVFWEGLYDGSNVLHDVKTDMWMQAKYYINLPEEPAFSPVTVRLNAASVPESWGQVYIYSWTPGAMDSVRWPGALMQMDDNGWYTYTFPAGVQDIDFLFDNGDGNVGNQTVDVDNVSSNYCFEMAAPLTYNGFYMVYPTDCSEIPQPEGMTIRLMRETNMGGWYFNNYIYAWQHIDSVDVPLLGQWPGAPMQLDDNGWFTYTFREEYDSINIVFSAGDVQTVDILGVTGSSCFQIGKGNGWINGMYVHNVKQVDCDVQPWQYHLVYFLTNNGTILDLQYVVDGDSAIAPDAPLIPGYEFVGWDKDFSHVTENMTILPIYRSSTPVEAYTVRLMPTNGFGWEDIYLYAWTTDSLGRIASQPLGSWPGTKIEKDSLTGWHSYTFEYDPVVNIIWNNGLSESSTYQTQDIMGVSESTCYRLYGRDSLFHLIAEPISCETNLADYRTVAFISGGVQMINQQPVGSHIEETPTIPYREGYTFAFWADSDRNMADSIIVTEDIAIYAWWSRNSYMVYILDGLTGELIISGEILYGNSVNNLDYFIPEHEGYEFIGWTNDLQYIEGVTFTIAQFRPITYGNTSIIYADKDAQMLDIQNVDLNLPEPPTYEGYSFIGWQVVSGDLNNGIMIQAAYRYDGGTGAPEVGDENRAARKVIRDEKVYIITPEGKVYSSDGKLVEVKR